MRKPYFCLCENKVADHFRCNCEVTILEIHDENKLSKSENIRKVKVGNGQEMEQSERNSHSKN